VETRPKWSSLRLMGSCYGILEPIQNTFVNPPFARHQTRRTYTPPTIFALQNRYLVH
jgi:hypothetical protein